MASGRYTHRATWPTFCAPESDSWIQQAARERWFHHLRVANRQVRFTEQHAAAIFAMLEHKPEPEREEQPPVPEELPADVFKFLSPRSAAIHRSRAERRRWKG